MNDRTTAISDTPDARTGLLIPTPFDCLTRELRGGVMPGDLTLCVGGTGSRKTDMAAHWAERAVAQGRPTLVLTVEMSSTDWMVRMASKRTKVPWSDLLTGRFDGVEEATADSRATPRKPQTYSPNPADGERDPLASARTTPALAAQPAGSSRLPPSTPNEGPREP